MQSDRRIRHVQIGKIEEEIEGGPNNSDSPHSQQMDPLPGPFRPKYPKGAGKAKRSLSSIEKETGSVLESYLSIIRIGLDLVRQRGATANQIRGGASNKVITAPISGL